MERIRASGFRFSWYARAVARLIGRTHELEKLHELWSAGTRCIEIIGAPGIGKSALMREWSERSTAEDTLIPSLDSATNEQDLYFAVADSLGMDREGGALATRLQTMLAARGGTLVLDQVEHLDPDAAARLIREWIDAAPRLQVVVATRRPLGVEDAETLRLKPLNLPSRNDDLEAAAAQLFLKRAQEVVPDLGGENMAEHIVSVVRRLDGVPLAIELAAHSLQRLSLPRLAHRLGTNVANLPGGLDAPILSSWDTLAETDQRVLAAVSVLENGFDADGAAAVASVNADVFPILGRLAAHSLLLRTSGSSGGARFAWLSPIRAFASKQVSELEEPKRRAARYYASLDREELTTEDLPNLEQALGWCLAGDDRDPKVAVSLFVRLASLHYPESTAAYCERLIAKLGNEFGAEAEFEVHTIGSRAAMLCQRWDLASTLLVAAMERSKTPAQRARVLVGMARVDLFRRNPTASKSWLEQIEPRADLGDELLAEVGNLNFGIALFSGRLQEALTHVEKALQHAQQLNDPRLLGWTLGNLAYVHSQMGTYSQALEVGRRAAEVARDAQSPVLLARALAILGGAMAEGAEPDAEDVLREAAELAQRHSETTASLLARMNIAHMLREREALVDARRETVVALEQAQGVFRGALEWHLGMIAHQEGELHQGLKHYDRAIELQRKSGLKRLIGTAHVVRAVAHARAGQLDRAEEDLRQPEASHGPDTLGLAKRIVALLRARETGQSAQTQSIQEHVARLNEDIRQKEHKRTFEDRFLLREAEIVIAELKQDTLVVQIARDGSQFRLPGTEPVSIARRKALTLVLAALAALRDETPGKTLGIDDLCKAGWPGERITRDAARRRVYVTINELRKKGLKDALLRHGTGYLLDPSITTVVD